MEQFIGLIVSIVLVVISSAFKKKVTEQSQKAQKHVASDADKYTVNYEDMLAQDVVQSHEEHLLASSDSSLETDVDTRKEVSDTYYDEKPKEAFAFRVTERTEDKKQIVMKQWDMAQAVVVSEIIRKPRALRPWPNR